ncbi:MAG: BamA/TamA family outer membrane protein [Candidatus Acidiferrales bacterium]
MEIESRTLRNSQFVRGSNTLTRPFLSVLLLCFAHFSLSIPCLGQQNQPAQQASDGAHPQESSAKPAAQERQPTVAAKPEAPPKKKKKLGGRGAFVVAPLPISSPAVGSGIVPVIGYIFPFSSKDKVSPPSTIGVAGLITNNGSRGFVFGGQLFLKQNTYEITSAYVRGNVNYNFYGTGIASNLKLPLDQTGQAFFGEVLRRVGWKIFVGPRFITGRSFVTVNPNSGSTVPIPPGVGLHTNLTSIGARINRDTRPNHFYPTAGTFFTFTSDFFSQDLGSKYTFQSYRSQFDKYWSVSKKQVLAYDAYFCGTGGSPPFYGNCIYGTSNELRGYTAGQYFTRVSLATQLEYRLVLPKRFGLVVFGGLGGVIPGGSQLFQRVQNAHFLPAGGGGLRFELSKKYHVNLRADIAQGTNGHTFGMGVGEAF